MLDSICQKKKKVEDSSATKDMIIRELEEYTKKETKKTNAAACNKNIN